MIVDAARLTYCDGAGAALLLELRRRQRGRQGTYEIRSLDPAYQALLDLYGRSDGQIPDTAAPPASRVARSGRATGRAGEERRTRAARSDARQSPREGEVEGREGNREQARGGQQKMQEEVALKRQQQ